MPNFAEELYLVKVLDSIDDQEDHKLYSIEELDYELDYDSYPVNAVIDDVD